MSYQNVATVKRDLTDCRKGRTSTLSKHCLKYLCLESALVRRRRPINELYFFNEKLSSQSRPKMGQGDWLQRSRWSEMRIALVVCLELKSME